MTDPENRFNELIAALKEKEYRLTPQRVELIRLIAASEGHPSAAELYERILQKFPTMSLATVYKTLALLKEMGQVLEIDLRDDNHYDGNRPQPHAHLICVKCNKIVDGEFDFDPDSINKLAGESGYTNLHPQFSFYGLCPECRETS
jgi:Fur family peroxide stress response transcriptional regulator